MRTAEATTSIDIAAPIELVWKVMTDLRAYSAWNPFIVRVDDAPAVLAIGSTFRLHVRWARGGGARSAERITRLEPPDGRAAVFSYRAVGVLDRTGVLRADRIQLLESLHDGTGGTRYYTVEEFGGCLVPLLPLGQIRDGFERQAEALKRRAESMRSATRGGA